MKEAKILLEIVKCFLWEKDYIPYNDIDEEKLYELAKINKLSNFLENWAKKYCQSEKVKNKIDQDYTSQIVKDTNQNIEIEKILNAFEKNKIKTLVVKGMLMKDIYPQNYMRQMCDLDILVDANNFKKSSQVMANIGYQKHYNYEKHLIFEKLPFMIVELHRKLVLEKDVVGYEYFSNIWPLCIKYKDYENIYQLDIDNAYVFCIVHLLIHFKFTGIKIKDILDVYLYNETYKDTLNYDKLSKIFNSLGIQDFAENIRNIAYKWFGPDGVEDFDEVEKFILKGSNLNNNVHYSIGVNNGKLNFLIKSLFPEMKIMREKFPVLKKFPLLLPVMWITRIAKDIGSKGGVSLKSRLHTIKLIKEADSEDVQKVKDIYDKLGVK